MKARGTECESVRLRVPGHALHLTRRAGVEREVLDRILFFQDTLHMQNK